MMINNFFNNEEILNSYAKNIINNLSMFIDEKITVEKVEFINIDDDDVTYINKDDFICIERNFYMNNKDKEIKKISYIFTKNMLEDIFKNYFLSDGLEDIVEFSKELTGNFTNELKLSFDKNDKITFEDEMLEKSFLHCESFYTYIKIIFKIKEKDYFILIHPYIMKNIENISNSENYEIIEKQYNGYKEIIFSDVISSLKKLNTYLNGIDYEKEKIFNKLTFILILLNEKSIKISNNFIDVKIDYNLIYNLINDINEIFNNEEITEMNLLKNDNIIDNLTKIFNYFNNVISNIYLPNSPELNFLTSIVEDCFNKFFYEISGEIKLIKNDNLDTNSLNIEIDDLISNIINNKEQTLDTHIKNILNIEKLNDVLLLIDSDIEGLNSFKQSTGFDIDNFVEECSNVILEEEHLCPLSDNEIQQMMNGLEVDTEEDEKREDSFMYINFLPSENAVSKKLSLSGDEIDNLLERAENYFSEVDKKEKDITIKNIVNNFEKNFIEEINFFNKNGVISDLNEDEENYLKNGIAFSNDNLMINFLDKIEKQINFKINNNKKILNDIFNNNKELPLFEKELFKSLYDTYKEEKLFEQIIKIREMKNIKLNNEPLKNISEIMDLNDLKNISFSFNFNGITINPNNINGFINLIENSDLNKEIILDLFFNINNNSIPTGFKINIDSVKTLTFFN